MHYLFDGSEKELEVMIAEAVRAALGHVLPQSAAPSPPKVLLLAPVLVAVCCQDCLVPPVAEQIRRLEEHETAVRIEKTDDWGEEIDMSQMVQSYQIVLFPALNENTLAEIAGGIFKRPLARLLLHSLKAGKAVYATVPQVSADLRKHSPALFRLAQAHRQKLTQFGVRLIEHGDLAKVLLSALGKSTLTHPKTNHSQEQKQLITAEDVETAAAQGQQKLHLAYRTIITPLARDRARELNIEMVLKG